MTVGTKCCRCSSAVLRWGKTNSYAVPLFTVTVTCAGTSSEFPRWGPGPSVAEPFNYAYRYPGGDPRAVTINNQVSIGGYSLRTTPR